MKKYLRLLLALSLLSGCSFLSQEEETVVDLGSATEVAEAWLDAIESGNFEAADQLVDNSQLELSSLSSRLGISDFILKQAISYVVEGYTVDGTSGSGQQAQVDVTIRAVSLDELRNLEGQDFFTIASSLLSASKQDYDATIYLQDENGAWKVENIELNQ